MIAQRERTRQARADEGNGRSPAASMPSKAALLRALRDLRLAEERGELPQPEADLLTRYLIALYTAYHVQVASEEYFGQLFERYATVLQEAFSG